MKHKDTFIFSARQFASICFMLAVILTGRIATGQESGLASGLMYIFPHMNTEPMGDKSALSAGSSIAKLGGGDMAWYNPAGVDYKFDGQGILRASGSLYSRTALEDMLGKHKSESTSSSYLSYTTGIGDFLAITGSLAQPVLQRVQVSGELDNDFDGYNEKLRFNLSDSWTRLVYGLSLKASLNNHHFGLGLKYNSYSISSTNNYFNDSSFDGVVSRSTQFIGAGSLVANASSFQYDFGYQLHTDFGLSFGLLYRSASYNESGRADVEDSVSNETVLNGVQTENIFYREALGGGFIYKEPELKSFGVSYENKFFSIEARQDNYGKIERYAVLEPYYQEIARKNNIAVDPQNMSELRERFSQFAVLGLYDEKIAVSETSFNMSLYLNDEYQLLAGYGVSKKNKSPMFFETDMRKTSVGVSVVNPYGVSVLGVSMAETLDRQSVLKYSTTHFVISGKFNL